MPQPTWILQKNLTKAQVLTAIKAALEADGIAYEEVLSIPFSDEVPEIAAREGLVFYGSTTLIFNASRDPRYSKGVFYDPEKFCMQNYLAQWGEGMLNHDSRNTTFAALAEEVHPDDAEFFIRPDADTKAFTGQVMTFAEIKTFARQLRTSENPTLEPDTAIALSRPKTIEKEWRSFVVDGKLISTTRYLHNGELAIAPQDVPESLISFLQAAIDTYQPHPVFVIDTALSDGRYAILECNCFNGTGFYGHDIPNIVRAVNEWVSGQT
jgi:hypothetical protein